MKKAKDWKSNRYSSLNGSKNKLFIINMYPLFLTRLMTSLLTDLYNLNIFYFILKFAIY